MRYELRVRGTGVEEFEARSLAEAVTSPEACAFLELVGPDAELVVDGRVLARGHRYAAGRLGWLLEVSSFERASRALASRASSAA